MGQVTPPPADAIEEHGCATCGALPHQGCKVPAADAILCPRTGQNWPDDATSGVGWPD